MTKLTKSQFNYLNSKDKSIKFNFMLIDKKISHIVIKQLHKYIKSPADLEKLTGIKRKTIVSILNNKNVIIIPDLKYYIELMKDFLILVDYVEIITMHEHYKDDLIGYREKDLPYSTEYKKSD